VRRDVDSLVYVASTQEKEPPVGAHFQLRSRAIRSALEASAKREVLAENGDILLQFRPFQTMVTDTLLRDRLMATLSGSSACLQACWPRSDSTA
jgi:hypothetical protein